MTQNHRNLLIIHRSPHKISDYGAALLSRYITLISTLLAIHIMSSCRDQVVDKIDSPENPIWASKTGHDHFGFWADMEVSGTLQRFRFIKAGSFTMGCDDKETDAAWANYSKAVKDEKREWFVCAKHDVTLTHSFWMADSKCTQGMWQVIMGTNPSIYHDVPPFHDDPERPVEFISWGECQEMVTKLNHTIPGLTARLPTEAEWEYTCRSGTSTALYTGGISYIGQNNVPELDSIAWYSGNSGIEDAKRLGVDSTKWPEKQYQHMRASTHPVKQKQPNAWGLYDMIGNVMEWCQDWYGPYSLEYARDPEGPSSGSARVIRGGSWSSPPAYCRSASRSMGSPILFRSASVGFRLCITYQTHLPQ